MKRLTLRTIALAVLAASVMLAGCARKQQQVPPTPPEAPPAAPSQPTQPPAPEPTPTPAQTPTPDAASGLRDAFFAFDSYALDDQARAALDATARVLRDNTSLNLTIEGHCDERGTVEYNQALGERRAMAARDYLAGAGISAGRLNVISYGKERPFAPGSDEASWAQNRRAHFVAR